jgi:putative transposase
MGKGEVQKGYHCVWQIHYETTYGIQERYAIEMEALGMDKNHIHLLSSAHPKIPLGEIVRIFKKYYCKVDIPKASGDQKRAMG